MIESGKLGPAGPLLPPAEAQEVLRAAMKIEHAPVPPVEGELLYRDDHFSMTREAFWFETPAKVRFHYRTGARVIAERPEPEQEDEYRLFLWGTVFGAVAWFNNLLPLHASAVERGGRIVAFSADSGGGKSTIAAGLAGRGFRHVCDDTLVVAADGERMFGLPDGKPIKLWRDALELVAANPTEPIKTVPGKYYSDPGSVVQSPHHFTDLVFLEWGDEPRIEAIRGSAKLEYLLRAMYRRFVHVARGDYDLHARLLTQSARSLRMWRYVRAKDPRRFDASLEYIHRHFRDL